MRLDQSGTSFTFGEMELFPMIYVLENTTVNCIHAILVGRNDCYLYATIFYTILPFLHLAKYHN